MRPVARLLGAAVPAALLLTGSLTGCSASEDDQRAATFCEDVPGLLQDVTADLQAFDGSDPAAGPQPVADAVTRLEAVEPPADVTDEWDRLVTAWTDASDVLARADPADPQANAGLAPELEAIGPELTAAGTAVDDWGQANC